jgi:AAHS family 4-hydroxybenzoate transporter-like MFS transporter
MTAARIDVAATIDRARLSGLQIRTITLCFSVAILDGFDAQLIGYAAPSITNEFGLGPAAFGAVFSAGLLGMVIGSFLFGTIADRIGRRAVIIFCTVLFALVTLALPLAGSLTTFVVLRFVAGLGLGGATPSLIALVAEYTPVRIRSRTVMVLVGSLSLGAFFGGIVATALIPLAGWRSVFIVGGGFPLVIVVVMLFGLPESVRFLNSRRRYERARELLSRIDPSAAANDSPLSAESALVRSPVAALFSAGRAVSTIVLWVVFFANLLVAFSLLSWLPTLFTAAGLAPRIAFAATATFSLGGFLGGLAMGVLIDRTGRPHRVLLVGYLLAVAGIVVTTMATSVLPLLLVAVFFIGVGIAGGQTGISALAAAMYPTAARGTGVGWAFGVGRIGSVLGPTVSGVLLAAGLGPTAIVGLAVGPVLVAAGGVSGLALLSRSSRQEAQTGNERLLNEAQYAVSPVLRQEDRQVR